MARTISARDTLVKGFWPGWFTNFAPNQCRYRVFWGGRATGKSTNIGGFEPIFKLLFDPRRNVLMVRKNDVDNARSTFTNLVWCIDALGLRPYFKISKNPMEITRTATGQVIIFKGFNSPTSLTSLKATVGYFTDIYFEEASELDDYEEFRQLDGTFRAPDGVDIQITFMLNGWDIGCMIYEHFVKGRLEDDPAYLESHGYADAYDPGFTLGFGWGLYLHQSTYRINPHRASYYDENMAVLKVRSPDIYRVEGLGCWGNTAEATYPEFSDGNIVDAAYARSLRYCRYAIGIDFGVSDGQGKLLKGDKPDVGSATSMQLVALTADNSKMVCIDEWFWSNEMQRDKKTGPQMQTEMMATLKAWVRKYESNPWLMKGKIPIYVDSADSGGFRDGLELEARRQGIAQASFAPSTKIKILSRVYFSRRLMSYGDFLVSRDCPNLIRELKSCKKGPKGAVREDVNDHAINASEYAWATFRRDFRQWKDFKEPN